MSKASRPYKEELLEDLRDPSEAAAYLTAALEDGSPNVFLLALRDVAEAHGMKQFTTLLKRLILHTYSILLLGILAAFCGCSLMGLRGQSGPNQIVLTNRHGKDTFNPDQLFYFQWEIEQRPDSTRAVTAQGSESIPARIIGRDHTHLWLESKRWNSVERIPRAYSKEKMIRFSRSKEKVQVGLPIHAITGVSLDVEQRVEGSGISEKGFLAALAAGAFGGFVFTMEFFVNEEEHDHDDDVVLLVLGTMGTLSGAVGYPIYKAIKKEKVSYRKKYLLTGADGFRLIIE